MEPFKVKGLPLRLEPETIQPLLRRAKDIMPQERPPAGRDPRRRPSSPRRRVNRASGPAKNRSVVFTRA